MGRLSCPRPCCLSTPARHRAPQALLSSFEEALMSMQALKSSPRLLFDWILFHSLDSSQSLGLLLKPYHAEILKAKIEPKPLKTLAGLLSCCCRTEPWSTGMAIKLHVIFFICYFVTYFSFEINIFTY